MLAEPLRGFAMQKLAFLAMCAIACGASPAIAGECLSGAAPVVQVEFSGRDTYRITVSIKGVPGADTARAEILSDGLTSSISVRMVDAPPGFLDIGDTARQAEQTAAAGLIHDGSVLAAATTGGLRDLLPS